MTLLSASIKNIDKAFKKFEDEQKVATSRTLNIQSNRAFKIVSTEIKKATGIKQATIRKSVKIKKATKFNQAVSWFLRGRRLRKTSPMQLKRGVSFLGLGKSRKKLVDKIEGGSRAFLIKGKNSGKDIVVYRKKGSKRTVTSIMGSSVPHLFGIIGVDNKRFIKLIMKGIEKEYSKQLRRAGFRRKR